MSNFTEYEKTGTVYHANDSDTTKITTYSSTGFTVDMFLIKRNEDTTQILGEEMGEWVANVKGSYTGASNIRRGDKVVWEGGTYQVVNKPRYNKLFDAYKIVLKKDD